MHMSACQAPYTSMPIALGNIALLYISILFFSLGMMEPQANEAMKMPNNSTHMNTIIISYILLTLHTKLYTQWLICNIRTKGNIVHLKSGAI